MFTRKVVDASDDLLVSLQLRSGIFVVLDRRERDALRPVMQAHSIQRKRRSQ